MAWLTDPVTKGLLWLRFVVRSTGVLAGFILGLFLLYFTGRVVWHFVGFLERTIFSQPW